MQWMEFSLLLSFITEREVGEGRRDEFCAANALTSCLLPEVSGTYVLTKSKTP